MRHTQWKLTWVAVAGRDFRSGMRTLTGIMKMMNEGSFRMNTLNTLH